MRSNLLNFNEFWDFYHPLFHNLYFEYFGDGDGFFNDLFNNILGCNNLLNSGFNRDNLLDDGWNFLNDFLNVRHYFLYFLNFGVNHNFFNNLLDFLNNLLLLGYSNYFLNNLRDLNNSFLNILLDHQFLHNSVHWNRYLNWNDDWFLNLNHLNVICIKCYDFVDF